MIMDISDSGYHPNLQHWIDWITGAHDDATLSDMLAQDVVFRSPVVHTPQHGKDITFAYLAPAGKTLGNDSFRYVRVFDCGARAVLEFETEMNGILVNGVDMIEWGDDGKITDFKVMVRPLKAMQQVHAAMGQMLHAMKSNSPA